MHINWNQTFDHSILNKFVFEEDPPEIYDCFSETETPACTLFFLVVFFYCSPFLFRHIFSLVLQVIYCFSLSHVLCNPFNH